MREQPIVRLQGISKSFGKVRANRDITLDIRPGRIKALLGENGAGKSTLMSILSGRYLPDAGRIEVDGRPVWFQTPRDALDAGIGMVYQHFMLVDNMTVAQNVLLGQEGAFFVRPREMEERVAALAEEYGLAVPPGAKVQDLSMGERQRTEILKLLHRDSRVLILDEPTAVLTPRETEQLFSALRRIASQGKAVVFISHKLQEVLDVADEIAILRNGHIVDEFGQGEHPTKAELANRMVGREVLLTLEAEGVFQEKVVLEIKHLSGHGLHDVDLAVRKGEIVAVAGVAGNGQKALVEVVTGLREPPEGEVRLLDTPWREFYARGRARKRWKGALGYIPEDRQGLATVRTLDMVDNVLLTTRQGFTKRMFLDRDKAEDATERLVQDFNVQPPLPQIRAYQLSGGNLQKLVLAREFFREPRIIVAEQPSQGLDVAATEEVWRQLLAARGRAGILLVTGDLNEAVQLADRIAVMFRGRIMDLFPASDKGKLDTIGLLMAGIHPDSGSDET